MTGDLSGSGNSETIFALLEGGTVGQTLTSRETDVRVAAGAVMHAVEPPRGRALLIPLGVLDEEPVADQSSSGITLLGRELLDDGVLHRYQSVSCDDPRLHLTFSSFCDEVLEALSFRRTGSANLPDPVVVCVGVLDRWRDLLNPRRSPLLAIPLLAGLLTELHVLEAVTDFHGPEHAELVWVAGDTTARHDFRHGSAAVEAKATVSHTRLKVTIHGLTQLEAPTDGTLYLVAEQLEPAPAGEDSVPDSLDRLCDKGHSRRRLLKKLAGRGYGASDEHSYRTIRFDRLADRSLVIDSRLPVLVPAALTDPTLANRLLDVTYVLDLTDMTAYETNVWSLAEVITALG